MVTTMSELLSKLGWSKAHFARMSGVDVRTVSRWIESEPELPMRYLRLCVRLLNV